jgi:hypothetical protein
MFDVYAFAFIVYLSQAPTAQSLRPLARALQSVGIACPSLAPPLHLMRMCVMCSERPLHCGLTGGQPHFTQAQTRHVLHVFLPAFHGGRSLDERDVCAPRTLGPDTGGCAGAPGGLQTGGASGRLASRVRPYMRVEGLIVPGSTVQLFQAISIPFVPASFGVLAQGAPISHWPPDELLQAKARSYLLCLKLHIVGIHSAATSFCVRAAACHRGGTRHS